MGCPAMGDAVIIVPGAASGEGFGLERRNRGWTSSSIKLGGGAGLDGFRCLDAGLEKLGGLAGGEEKLASRGLPGIQPKAVAESELGA